ncbi:hypothetical protein [Faucicola boevrei]|uniref:hypothetical protein n=1 Tax=Faucicola boevrei TaxID=346665 RepID=UPI000361E9D6|nr:hypothetical protein [Moraxella boevrei]
MTTEQNNENTNTDNNELETLKAEIDRLRKHNETLLGEKKPKPKNAKPNKPKKTSKPKKSLVKKAILKR